MSNQVAKVARENVVERLLAVARLIRRKGNPDEAEVAVAYERQFEHDLAELNAQKDLALPPVSAQKEMVAA